MLLITPIASSLVINESISTTSGLSLLILSHNSSPSFAQKITEIFLLCKILRFDPAVNRALDYAVAYGFVVQQPTGNFKLTDNGKSFAERIKIEGNLMATEIKDLTELSKKLTETRIKELVEIWEDKYAQDK